MVDFAKLREADRERRLADHEAARWRLLQDGEFPPSASLDEMARSLLIQRDNARRATEGWRSQVLAVHEADLAAATVQSEGRG
jgi:hypothetical protein